MRRHIGEIMKRNRMRKFLGFGLLILFLLFLRVEEGKSQPAVPAGQVDFFMGVDFNYRDITYDKLYEFLINLTPGVKWNMGKQWQVAAQALIPVYNDYGERYKRIRLSMATLSKELYFKERYFLKVSGGMVRWLK